MKKLAVLILAVCMLQACSKSPDQDKIAKNEVSALPAVSESEDLVTAADEIEAKEKTILTEETSNLKDSEGIKTPYFGEFPAGKNRLLEYRVGLQYDSKDILKSREMLLHLVEKYGYIKSASTSADSDSPYFNSEIMIETKNYLTALKEFNALGILKSESIEVVDHTPDKILNDIQQEREESRIKRRSAYTDRASTANRNFSGIEQSLAESENALDDARFNKWQIEDKITWTTVNISVTGPLPARSITVPDYKKAFILLAEIMLKLVYAAIILIPLWLIIIIITIKKQWFKKVFLSKVKK